jgi:aminoglycoside N3'-acetyltransferase
MQAQRPHVTQAHIEADLRALGLHRGDLVEVHSSLHSLGWVEGDAPAVVEALMTVLGDEGALVMSAFPLSKHLPLTDAERARGLVSKARWHGEGENLDSCMGAIADAFRRRPGVLLGRGQHRVCAWGRDAARHSQGLQYLLERDGWALLLGVEIHSCTSMHYFERGRVPPEVQAYWRAPEELLRAYPEERYVLGYGRTPVDGWGRVFEIADQRGLVTRGRVGAAECLLFRARAMGEIYDHALETDPYALWGVPRS